MKRSWLGVGIAIGLGVTTPALSMPPIVVRGIYGYLDPPSKDAGLDPKRCSQNALGGTQGIQYCDQRYGAAGLSLGISGHYPLVSLLRLSVAPFLEGFMLYAPELLASRLRGGVMAGFDLWYWVLGGRLRVGPQIAGGYVLGGFKMNGGLGVAWCLACSVPDRAGAFRRSLDSVVLRRSGSFNPARKQGDAFDGSLDRWELGLVFKLGQGRTKTAQNTAP
ncbi:MAG: hypothetical protein ACK5QT_00215 [Oligoflexia bacterium]